MSTLPRQSVAPIWVVAAVVALTAVGLVLRMVWLDSQLWFDEIVTLMKSVRLPFDQIVTTYPWDNQHTLYSVLAKLSVTALGESPWTLRLPAALLGTATIPALYWFARRIAPPAEALAAAALLTVSYHHVLFSQNARGYTGLMLATVVATGFFLELVQAHRRRDAIAYAAVVALGCYFHLTMVFVAASHALIVCVLAAVQAARGRVPADLLIPACAIVASGLLTIAIYSPMLDAMLAHFKVEHSSVESEWTTVTWAAAETVRGLRIGLGSFALLPAIALVGVGAWQLARSHPVALSAMVLPGIVGMGVFVALGRHIWPRFLFFVAGFGLLIVVRGVFAACERAARRIGRNEWGVAGKFAATGAMIVASLFLLPRNYAVPKQDFEGALAYLRSRHAAQEHVGVVGLATLAILDFHDMPWTRLDDDDAFERFVSRPGDLWIVYTFPIYVRSRLPKTWSSLDSDFRVTKVFPASIGGGEIYVARRVDPVGDRQPSAQTLDVPSGRTALRSNAGRSTLP